MLTDPSDMLTTGIEVEARPPGKKVKRLSLLSGGERSLTAMALLVAIFRARPSPFYVLDEIEAALDDVNLRRLISLLEELRATSQLIVITHQKPTMEVADALYGVSMRGDGITTVISQRLRAATASRPRGADVAVTASAPPTARPAVIDAPAGEPRRGRAAAGDHDASRCGRTRERARGGHRGSLRGGARDRVEAVTTQTLWIIVAVVVAVLLIAVALGLVLRRQRRISLREPDRIEPEPGRRAAAEGRHLQGGERLLLLRGHRRAAAVDGTTRPPPHPRTSRRPPRGGAGRPAAVRGVRRPRSRPPGSSPPPVPGGARRRGAAAVAGHPARDRRPAPRRGGRAGDGRAATAPEVPGSPGRPGSAGARESVRRRPRTRTGRPRDRRPRRRRPGTSGHGRAATRPPAEAAAATGAPDRPQRPAPAQRPPSGSPRAGSPRAPAQRTHACRPRPTRPAPPGPTSPVPRTVPPPPPPAPPVAMPPAGTGDGAARRPRRPPAADARPSTRPRVGSTGCGGGSPAPAPGSGRACSACSGPVSSTRSRGKTSRRCCCRPTSARR